MAGLQTGPTCLVRNTLPISANVTRGGAHSFIISPLQKLPLSSRSLLYPHISYGPTFTVLANVLHQCQEGIPEGSSALVINIPQIASLDIEVIGGKQQCLVEGRYKYTLISLL
jgi:hypothetical protein